MPDSLLGRLRRYRDRKNGAKKGYSNDRDELSRLLSTVDSRRANRSGKQPYVEGKRTKQLLGYCGLFLIAFWVCSIIAYRSITTWSFTESLFYVVNVGLGVGYEFPVTTVPGVQWFTSTFVFISAATIGTITTLIASLLVNMRDAVDRNSQDEENMWTPKQIIRIGYMFWMLGFWLFYAAAPLISVDFQAASALLFVVAAATGTGVENPPNVESGTLWVTIIFLIIGVPLNSLFWGSIADDAFLFAIRYLTNASELSSRPDHIVGRRYSALARKSEEHKVHFGGLKVDILTAVAAFWAAVTLISVAGACLCLHFKFDSWNAFESFFFTLNVMLGIGYTEPSIPTAMPAKLILALLCFAGAFLLLSGLLILNLMFQVVRQKSRTRTTLIRYGSFVLYALCIFFGFLVANSSMNRSYAGSILFSISTMTSAGIVSVYNEADVEINACIFMIFAVPTQFVFWSYWTTVYINSEESRAFFRARPFIANKMRLWLRRARTEIARRNYEVELDHPAEEIEEELFLII